MNINRKRKILKIRRCLLNSVDRSTEKGEILYQETLDSIADARIELVNLCYPDFPIIEKKKESRINQYIENEYFLYNPDPEIDFIPQAKNKRDLPRHIKLSSEYVEWEDIKRKGIPLQYIHAINYKEAVNLQIWRNTHKQDILRATLTTDEYKAKQFYRTNTYFSLIGLLKTYPGKTANYLCKKANQEKMHHLYPTGKKSVGRKPIERYLSYMPYIDPLFISESTSNGTIYYYDREGISREDILNTELDNYLSDLPESESNYQDNLKFFEECREMAKKHNGLKCHR